MKEFVQGSFYFTLDRPKRKPLPNEHDGRLCCMLIDIPLDVTGQADKAFKRYKKHTAKSNRHHAEYEQIQKEIDLILKKK